MVIKKRYFVVFAALILILGIGRSLSDATSQRLRASVLGVMGPVIRMVDRGCQIFSRVDKGLQTLEQAQAEVGRLKLENAQLATENGYLRDLNEENARLREMLGFKKASSYKLMACRVAGRDPSTWWNIILVNRGWADDPNLCSDLPVVSPRGVVGKTGIVSKSISEVILMVNENCKISATLESTREQGIVEGETSVWEGAPRAKMTFIPRSAQPGVGERVFSSGLGGVFPPGLFLGTVAEVPPLSPSVNFGLYREIVIEPAVDLNRLDELFVIIGVR